jgi:hypothetical protein
MHESHVLNANWPLEALNLSMKNAAIHPQQALKA